MKRQLIKPVTAVLAASLMMSVFTACNSKGGKSKHEGRKISEDTPWYNSTVVDPELGYDKDRDADYVYSDMIGSDDKYIYVYTNGSYEAFNEDDWENYDWKANEISVVSVIDRDTFETVRSINLTNMLTGNESIYSAYCSDGKIIGVASGWDDETYVVNNFEVVIDPETGKIVDRYETADDSQNGEEFTVGDYKIKVMNTWTEESSYCTLVVTSPDGNEKKIELKEHGKDVYGVTAAFSIDKDNVLVPASSNDGTIYYEVNLVTGELSKGKEEDYSWMDISSIYYAFNASDGNVYYTSPIGISKIDVSKKTTEEIFNYSWSDVDRNIVTNLQLADVTDDSFILCGNVYKDGPYGSDTDFMNLDITLVRLQKADKNPHVGKTILELYSSYGYVDEEISKQIREYNNTNGNYFIEVTDRYSDNSYSYSDVNSDDEAAEREMDYFSTVGNKLSMDIINGEGPDMFLNISFYDSLKKEEYLEDLTPYVGKLKSDKYFTNVLDLFKNDGKLYNVPICFGVTGIQTDAQYAGKSGVGFTTEEYEKFLKDTLNGTDVLTSGQAYYFAQLFDYMKDKFIVKGKADFSAPEFKVLAEYVKNNVPESSRSWDEMTDEDSENSQIIVNGAIVDTAYTGPATYSLCYGYYSYVFMVEQLNGATSILGLPSADGRGPLASPGTTIAISAHACDVDACGEFVKMLMSDDVQKEYATNGSLVLNREIFREIGMEAMDYYNTISIQESYIYDGSPAPKNKITFSSDTLDALENCILSCASLSSQDADIEKILIEEMPAYFSGQKDINEVIKVAENRVQKVLAERG